MPFKALKLSDAVLRGVQAAGYTDPTPIQLRSIPVVLGGGNPYFAAARPRLTFVSSEPMANEVVRLTYVPA